MQKQDGNFALNLFTKNAFLKRLIAFLIIFSLPSSALSHIILDTTMGKYTIEDELIEEVLKSESMQRLKKIDVSGPAPYFSKLPKFSRFDHSIGVMLLVKKAGRSRKEQVAALLHDVSHTAFSHIGDNLFYKSNMAKSYQDIVHLEFIKNTNLPNLLQKHNIKTEDLDPDKHEYSALERELPDLCADRIQYLIHTGVILGKISKKTAKNMVDDLKFENDKWFFSRSDYAETLGYLSLDFTENIYGSPYNAAIYEYFTKILKRATALGLFSQDDIKKSTDKEILYKLSKSCDWLIVKSLKTLRILDKKIEVVPFGEGECNQKPKFRGVDPYVKIGSGDLVRISAINPDYRKKFKHIQEFCNKGFGVNIKE
ncbi:MAG: HD domain-containing protein [Rickettsiaceae bacterium]|nr:HD domain-containing protein [Rickettsiaceae bacterium]